VARADCGVRTEGHGTFLLQRSMFVDSISLALDERTTLKHDVSSWTLVGSAHPRKKTAPRKFGTALAYWREQLTQDLTEAGLLPSNLSTILVFT